MKQLAPDLWQSERYSFDERTHRHAYLLTRPTGNLLIYHVAEPQDDDLDQIERLGGVAVQLLSHRDESSPALNRIRERFGSRLACSAAEAQSVGQDADVDLVISDDCPDPQLDGLEILDTPGHTDGSLSFRYQSPHGQTYLFTGDTIFPNGRGWGVFVLERDGGEAESLERSLALLREQSPDLVLSSAFGGDTGAVEVTQESWADIVDQRIARLRQWATA